MDITSSNAIVMLSVATIFPVPQRLQKFGADAMFATDDVEPAEIGKGVDGNMFAGYTPYNTPQTYTIMPDSPSLTLFEQWLAAMKANSTIYVANGTIAIPSIGKKYTMTRGVLGRIRAIPNAQKVLQAMEYQVVWDSVDAAPF
ncbi:phage tail fiber protein [Paraburkholderia saeva]|uniref:phage tail fiber protein n=1 Tax=Paraburkholderia saeva TaxID=2777537 RepID=UPI001D79FB8B|nr:hypothetical protein [Paraburkholderia saeva]CAG4887986.1 hypothetical protein R52603_00551 [Paraburkholderia saeva]